MNKLYALCLIALAMLTSCSKNAQEALMPLSTGAPYDVYLVMADDLKETPLNDSLHAIFEYPMECTPNGDEYFYVSTISPSNFTRSIRTLGNIVMVDVDSQNASEPYVSIERDKYARQQVIVKMHGQNAQSLADHIMTLQEGLRNIFVKAEIKRAVEKLEKDNALLQNERLMKLQNVSLLIPYAIKKPGVGKTDKNFFWVTDDYMDKQSHIVVYSVPYTDANIFSLEGAVAVRDSVMKANIEGGDPDSYMTTNKRIILPEYKALNLNGKYVGELRGMWRMENGLMAGPFVCHMRLDELNKRVVFAEGFCYAPHDGKRKLIRNLEATLYTLKLPSDNMMSEIEITME
ncbi:MAG: DUF4837 family protein [Bacteroidales bacterium]|nr:DUF4837 family protein [Candidatus Liminaster caballi]